MRPAITVAYVFAAWVVLVLVVLGLDTLVAYVGFLLHARAQVGAAWAIAAGALSVIGGLALVDHFEGRWPPRHGGVLGICGVLAFVSAMLYLLSLGQVLELRPLVEHGVRIDAVVAEEHEYYSSDSPPGFGYTIRRLDGTEIPGELGAHGDRLEIGQRISVVVDPEHHSAPLMDPKETLVTQTWMTRVSGTVSACLLVAVAWGGPRPKRLMP